MTFKNITIKKRGGGTRTQRVKVLASGKYKFVKNLGKTKSKSSNPKSSKKKTGKVKKMAKKKRRRSNTMTIPLAVVAPLAGGVLGNTVYGTGSPLDAAMEGNFGAAANRLSINFLGYNFDDGSFNITHARALGALAIGLLVHKFVGGSPLNLNRILASHKIPFIRI